ncbi:hypothetical protein Bpfe_003597 [Biomphalaria pfeifferi]|uniref:Uncharacterized protein n=1 Tax=Biomphalaria pfeifferi TaxID=112525 RepID=A0AAD8C6I9_BIOPF|nr:hypothetical protein Bpfe_003597 [Biomphalaria pfeifferi]
MDALKVLFSVYILFGFTIGTSGHHIKFFPIQKSDENTYTCNGFVQNETIYIRGEAKVNGYSDTTIQIIIHKHFQESNQYILCEIELKSNHTTEGCSYDVTEQDNVFSIAVTVKATTDLSFGKISGKLLNNKEIKDSHEVDLPGIYEQDSVNASVVINQHNVESQNYLNFSDNVLQISATCKSLVGSCHLQLRLNDTPTLLETDDKLQFEASYPQPRYVSIILKVYNCNRNKVLKIYTYDVLIAHHIEERSAIAFVIILAPMFYPLAMIVLFWVCFRRSSV